MTVGQFGVLLFGGGIAVTVAADLRLGKSVYPSASKREEPKLFWSGIAYRVALVVGSLILVFAL